MLRFDVYRNGAPAETVDLDGAYVFGQDSVPVRAEMKVDAGVITCTKRAAGASGLAIVWDAGPAGRYLLPTTRLPERKESYLLNLELARAQILRLVQKREDWGLFDYPDASELNEHFDQARGKFVEALKAPDAASAAALADESLSQAITLGEKVALFHAGIFLGRRKSTTNTKTNVGCFVDLLSYEEKYCERLQEAFDFLRIPMPWKQIQPQESQHQYDRLDAWLGWAARSRKPVFAGPLLSFSPSDLPEWVYIWENDYEALRELILEHIEQLVKRYAQKVHVWNVVSGIHAQNSFNLTFEQLMELTRMSCLLVKKHAPKAKVMIELVTPWGEYYARNQRTIPPLLYADMAVQSGIKFDTFGVQLCMGAPEEGHYVRDLLQVSSLLDEFVGFGKPVNVTACQVPSDVTPDAWDAWGGAKPASDAGQWHAPWSQRLQAEWLQAFCRVSISKPFVESLCWRDLADYEGHFIPHGGLCRNNLEPKLAYRELRNFRVSLAAARERRSGRSKKKNEKAGG
jgi:glycosyl hydrolase family 10